MLTMDTWVDFYLNMLTVSFLGENHFLSFTDCHRLFIFLLKKELTPAVFNAYSKEL